MFERLDRLFVLGAVMFYIGVCQGLSQQSRVVEATVPNYGCVVVPKSKSSKSPETISGGILNAKALYVPRPPAVRDAKGRLVHGKIWVQVLVDHNGSIVSALGTSGNNLLIPPAESAAFLAKFGPTLLDGKPVNVSGLIWFRF